MTAPTKRKELPAAPMWRAPLITGEGNVAAVEFDLGKRGIIRVTHRGDHVEVNAVNGRIVIRPSVSNVIDVTTDGQS